jgi:hypothetical protein
MYVLPPAANPLAPGTDCPWLPPIRFRVQPYLKLCRSFDLALFDLEARYPSRRRMLTLTARNQRLRRRPK